MAQKTQTFGGKTYYLYHEYNSKTTAQKVARDLRQTYDYNARVKKIVHRHVGMGTSGKSTGYAIYTKPKVEGIHTGAYAGW